MLFTDELQKIYNESESADECIKNIAAKIRSKIFEFFENVNASENKNEALKLLKIEMIRLNNQWNYACCIFNKNDKFNRYWNADAIKKTVLHSFPVAYIYIFGTNVNNH